MAVGILHEDHDAQLTVVLVAAHGPLIVIAVGGVGEKRGGQRLSVTVGQHLAHDIEPVVLTVGCRLCVLHILLNGGHVETERPATEIGHWLDAGRYAEHTVVERGGGLQVECGSIAGADVDARVEVGVGGDALAVEEKRWHAGDVVVVHAADHVAGVGQINLVGTVGIVAVVGESHHIAQTAPHGVLELGCEGGTRTAALVGKLLHEHQTAVLRRDAPDMVSSVVGQCRQTGQQH